MEFKGITIIVKNEIRREATVILTETAITWNSKGTSKHDERVQNRNNERFSNTFPLQHVLAVRKADSGQKITLHVIQETNRCRLRVHCITLECPTIGDLDILYIRIKTALDAPSLQRPRRLLVVVNSFSGARKGQQIYKNQIEPIFQLANIETHTFTPKDLEESTTLIYNYDLSTIDGLIAVGGDGTFSECAIALQKRLRNDAELSSDDDTLLPLPIRLGMIGVGSSNIMCSLFNGTTDPVTSALHIATGSNHTFDMYTARSKDFFTYSCLGMTIGLSANFIAEAEMHRRFGKLRAPFTLLKSIVQGAGACKCEADVDYCDDDEGGNRVWKTLHGTFCEMEFHTTMGVGDREEQQCNMSDGRGRLYLLKHCSRLQMLSFYKAFYEYQAPTYHHSFMDYIEAKVIRVRNMQWLTRECNNITRDGELMPLPLADIEFKAHNGILKTFARNFSGKF